MRKQQTIKRLYLQIILFIFVFTCGFLFHHEETYASTKTYQTDAFDKEYSGGYFTAYESIEFYYLGNKIDLTPGSSVNCPGIQQFSNSTQGTVTNYFLRGFNTERRDDTYIKLTKAANYNGYVLDVVIYPWAEAGYVDSEYGYQFKYKSTFTNGNYSKYGDTWGWSCVQSNSSNYYEYHFFKTGTDEEVDFKGVLLLGDLDNVSGCTAEGACVYGDNGGDIYVSSDTTVNVNYQYPQKKSQVGNSTFLVSAAGTTTNAESGMSLYSKYNEYVTVGGTKESPIIVQGCGKGDSSINITGSKITYKILSDVSASTFERVFGETYQNITLPSSVPETSVLYCATYGNYDPDKYDPPAVYDTLQYRYSGWYWDEALTYSVSEYKVNPTNTSQDLNNLTTDITLYCAFAENVKYTVNHYITSPYNNDTYHLNKIETLYGPANSDVTLSEIATDQTDTSTYGDVIVTNTYTFIGGKAGAASDVKPSSFDTTATLADDGSTVINLYYNYKYIPPVINSFELVCTQNSINGEFHVTARSDWEANSGIQNIKVTDTNGNIYRDTAFANSSYVISPGVLYSETAVSNKRQTYTITITDKKGTSVSKQATLYYGSITYDANGGTGEILPTYQQLTSATARSNVALSNGTGFTRNACNIIGWNTRPDGMGTHYNLGETIALGNADITLYAEWLGTLVYSEDYFDEVFTRGYFDIKSTSYSPSGWTRFGSSWVDSVSWLGSGYYVKNTSRNTSIYADHPKGFVYEDIDGTKTYYDVREYVWLSNAAGDTCGGIYQSGSMSVWNAATNADSSGGRSKINREFHFYEAGHCGDSNYERSVTGLALVGDLDGDPGIYDHQESISYSNNKSAVKGFWVTPDTTLISLDAYSYGGTVQHAEQPFGAVWTEFVSTPSSPLSIAYCGNGCGGAKWSYTSGLSKAQINYHVLDKETNTNSVYTSTLCTQYTRYTLAEMPNKTNYTFYGWYKDPNFQYESGEQYKIDGYYGTTKASQIYVVDLYGIYSGGAYTITYHSSSTDNISVEGEMPTQQAFCDNNVKLIKNQFISDYEFVGWAKEENASTAIYKDEETLTPITTEPNTTIHLYAVWRPIVVSYEVNHYLTNEDGTYQLIEKDSHTGIVGNMITASSFKKEFDYCEYINGSQKIITSIYTNPPNVTEGGETPTGATVVNHNTSQTKTRTAKTVYINQDGFYRITVAGSPGQYAWAKHLCPDVYSTPGSPATYIGRQGGSGAIYTGIAYIKAGTTLQLEPNKNVGTNGTPWVKYAANSSNAAACGCPNAFLQGQGGTGGYGSEISIVNSDNSKTKLISAAGGVGAYFPQNDGFSCSYLYDGYSWERIWIPYLAGGSGGGSNYIANNSVLNSNTFEWVSEMTTLTNDAIRDLSSLSYTSGYASVEYMSGIVIIDPNGGLYKGSRELTSIEVKSGDSITLETPIYNDHVFKSWAVVEGSDCKVNGNNIVAGTTAVYLKAIWEEDNEIEDTFKLENKKYAINLYYDPKSFSLNFITEAPATFEDGSETKVKTVTYGRTANISTTDLHVTNKGYNLTGWKTADGTVIFDKTGTRIADGIYWKDSKWVYTGDVNLYPVYEGIYYTVTYSGGGAKDGSTADSKHQYGVPKKLTKNGFSYSSGQITYDVNVDDSATASVDTQKEKITYQFKEWISGLSVQGYEGVYDGGNHSIIVSYDGKVTYATQISGPYTETKPMFSEAGTHYVYYKLDDGTGGGIETVVITKAESSYLTTPTLTKIVESSKGIYTTKASAILNGTTDCGTIVYSIDGGEYTADIPEINDGDPHVIKYYIKGDNNHNDSAVSTISVLGWDKVAPTLTVTAPTGTSSGSPSGSGTTTFTVNGTVTDNDTGVEFVTVNGNKATLSGSSWSYNITLPSDMSVVTVTIVATDKFGNEATATRYVKYTPVQTQTTYCSVNCSGSQYHEHTSQGCNSRTYTRSWVRVSVTVTAPSWAKRYSVNIDGQARSHNNGQIYNCSGGQSIYIYANSDAESDGYNQAWACAHIRSVTWYGY